MGEADELFNKMDIDKDGRISLDECFSHFELRQVNLPENICFGMLWEDFCPLPHMDREVLSILSISKEVFE